MMRETGRTMRERVGTSDDGERLGWQCWGWGLDVRLKAQRRANEEKEQRGEGILALEGGGGEISLERTRTDGGPPFVCFLAVYDKARAVVQTKVLWTTKGVDFVGTDGNGQTCAISVRLLNAERFMERLPDPAASPLLHPSAFAGCAGRERRWSKPDAHAVDGARRLRRGAFPAPRRPVPSSHAPLTPLCRAID